MTIAHGVEDKQRDVDDHVDGDESDQSDVTLAVRHRRYPLPAVVTLLCHDPRRRLQPVRSAAERNVGVESKLYNDCLRGKCSDPFKVVLCLELT